MSGCSRGKTEIQTEAAAHEPKHTIPGSWNPETDPFVVSIFSYTYQPQQRAILYIFWTNRKPHLTTDVIKSLASLVLPVHSTHMHGHWSARVKRTQPPPKCSAGSQPKTSMDVGHTALVSHEPAVTRDSPKTSVIQSCPADSFPCQVTIVWTNSLPFPISALSALVTENVFLKYKH